MKKEPVVDYLDAVARFSRELNASEEEASLPEPAGEQVVDYQAVSDQWKEKKAEMQRLVRFSGQEDD